MAPQPATQILSNQHAPALNVNLGSPGTATNPIPLTYQAIVSSKLPMSDKAEVDKVLFQCFNLWVEKRLSSPEGPEVKEGMVIKEEQLDFKKMSSQLENSFAVMK